MKRQILVLLCAATLVFSQACATQDTAAQRPATGSEIAQDAGLGLGAIIASIVYVPFKVVYAAGGLVVGSIAWAFSGADDDVARSVIEPAIAGDYVITPDRLRDPSSIEFFGRADPSDSSGDRQQVAARAWTSQSELAAVSAPPPTAVGTTDIIVPADIAKRLATGACAGTVSLPPIEFAFGEDELSRYSRHQLDSVPLALSRCSDSRVRIVGHADATGSKALNLSLSERRAHAIRDYLVSRGADVTRLEIVAAGETNPASSNTTSTGRATNRRAEIVVDMG